MVTVISQSMSGMVAYTPNAIGRTGLLCRGPPHSILLVSTVSEGKPIAAESLILTAIRLQLAELYRRQNSFHQRYTREGKGCVNELLPLFPRPPCTAFQNIGNMVKGDHSWP